MSPATCIGREKRELCPWSKKNTGSPFQRRRNAEVEKIPYVVVWGDRESEGALAVREHGGEQSTKSFDGLLSELRQAATV